ncbi:alpha/beta hydrolase [Ructibacterium gallinarum]|uniref:Alpha/beta hydrolase n=1 Tax=Ructibacterium gallinarum TaxID=2779355 RepID=A0A9D5M5K1_9FIRM|nr:alpha/beta hydrolase [Ructibacterium gallinarum]MBE5039857.1 alpha/beta hydrolase [Ructibacterium gallinarum]
MLHFEVDMSVDYKAMGCAEPAKAPKLSAYILDERYLEDTNWKTRPAVVICPGGGYGFVSPREAEPIAMRYCGAGYHAFVLDYSIAPTGWPAACCELSKAVAYVRSIAEEHHIDKDKIAVCGFSAGGHLAASLGVYYDEEMILKYSGAEAGENRPNGMILGYPVITGEEEKTHMGTLQNFMAGREEVRPYFPLEEHVTPKTPKTFLWHTFSDGAVPVESSMRFAAALLKNRVEYELHIFPEGEHGLSLANKITASTPGGIIPAVQPWVDMSIRWLAQL